jgi:predicted PurR-regulated permease PerM
MSPDPARRGVAAASAPASGLAMLQGGLLIIAVLYFASDLLIPLVFAVLLAFVLAPVSRVFRRFGLPRPAAVMLAVLLAFSLLLGIGLLMARQASSLADNLPVYQASIAEKLSGLQARGGLVDRITATFQEFGQSFRRQQAPVAAPPGDLPGASGIGGTGAAPAGSNPTIGAEAAGTREPLPVVIREAEPSAMQTLQTVAEPLLHPLATAGIVLILVVFILLYREDLRDRMIRLAGARDLHRTMAAMDDAAYRLSRFFLAQVALNTGFGVFIAITLWLIGIPSPLLWGFVAGLMRFVPFIGSYIAAALPLLLALAVDPGWTTLALVFALFAISEFAMGQVFEPWIFGHSTGLSPVAVIAAATFWTWLWGPVGLLLAVPLTVCLVVLGRHVDRLEFLEVMLGDQPALGPEETFYQRALAGDLDALAEQSERFLKEQSLEDYLDAVALPALRLAQADQVRGALAPERLERLRECVLTLLEDLEEAEEKRPDEAREPEEGGARPVPPAWRMPGAILCLGGRGPLDALLAAMLAQVLVWRGYGVHQGGAVLDGADPGSARVACLCLIEGGSSAAAARYQLRRTRRRLRGVPILGLAWQGEETAEDRLAAALRAENAATPLSIARSLREAADMVDEAAAADPGAEPAPPPAANPIGAPEAAAAAPA